MLLLLKKTVTAEKAGFRSTNKNMQKKEDDQKFVKAPHLQLLEFLVCLVKTRNRNSSSHFLAAGGEQPLSQMPITVC